MTLRKLVAILAALNAGIFAAQATLSYVEAPAAHYTQRDAGEIAFHDHIAHSVASAIAPITVSVDPVRTNETDRVRQLTTELSGGGWMTDPSHFVILYATPILLSTLVTLTLWAMLARGVETIDAGTPALLLRWSYVYAAIMALAMPTLVEDFWLSVGWGRMLLAGMNPYYHLSAQSLAHLPLETPGMHMTYGPLWAMVAFAVESLTRGSVFLSAVVFKALLLAAWILTLRLVARLVRERSVWDQCLAITMVGWLPVGVIQTLGDGHNDIFMVVLILMWLWLLEKRRPVSGSVALALSITVKYATAPLLLLDLLHRENTDTSPTVIGYLRGYLPKAFAIVAVVVLVFAPVFRGGGFFAATSDVNRMQFFLPSGAVRAMAVLFHLPIWRFANFPQIIFPIAALVTVWNYVRVPARDTFRIAVAGIMLTVLFNAAGHVWPWYVIWLLVVSAIVPRSLIARWATGVALTAPFPLIAWTAFPDSSNLAKFWLPSLFAYGGALLWMIWLWRYFVPQDIGDRHDDLITAQSATTSILVPSLSD